MRLLLHGPRGRRGTGECGFFLVHPLPDDHGSLGEAGTMPSSCASPRLLLEEFPVHCARAVRTLNLVHYFRVLVSGSHCSGCLGVADEYENWTFFVGAVDTCSASVLWI